MLALLTNESIETMTLKHRIETAIAFRGIRQNEVERRCAMAPGVLAQLKDRVRPNPEQLAKVAAVLGVNSQWLKTGKGSPAYETPWTERVFEKGQAADDSEDERADQHIVLDERYPNREPAIQMYTGIAHEQVLRTVRSMSLKSKDDLSYDDWCKVIEQLMKQRKRIEAGESVGEIELDLSMFD